MSGAASRRKGNKWETDVCQLLRDHGWQAMTSRAGRGGTQSGADIISDLPVCIEAKNQKQIDLSGWLDQAIRQAPGDLAAVFVKRRQKPPEHGYVVMRADQYLALVEGHRPAKDDT